MSRRARGGDARIFGPEPWAVIGGVELSHWDLWFLVVMRDLSGGKRELVRLFHARGRFGLDRSDREQKLSHLLDLETRLLAAGLTHDEVLELVAIDKPLLRKARDKVLERSAGRLSQAMIDMPRKLLSERALRGHWPRFPMDPALFDGFFGPLCRAQGDYGWRLTPIVAESVRCAWKTGRTCFASPPGSVGAGRATLTRIIELMNHVDDSMADMATLFEEVLEVYVGEVWAAGVEPEVALRDGIELGVWEDYGLSDGMRPFLRSIPLRLVEQAIQIFYETTAELAVHGLEYQYDTAHGMWATLLAARGRFDEFERLARRFGPDVYRPAVELVEAAAAGGMRDVALGVLAALDRPGSQHENLRAKCDAILASADRPPRPR